MFNHLPQLAFGRRVGVGTRLRLTASVVPPVPACLSSLGLGRRLGGSLFHSSTGLQDKQQESVPASVAPSAPNAQGSFVSRTRASCPRHVPLPGNDDPTHPEFHPDANITLRELGIIPAPIPRVYDSDTVAMAVDKMIEFRSATCLVVQKDRSMQVTGIISSRDLVRFSALSGQNPMQLRCRDLAISNPMHVTQFASLERIMQLMKKNAMRTILVAPSVLGGLSKEEELSRSQIHASEVLGAVSCFRLLDSLMAMMDCGPEAIREDWETLTVAEMLQVECHHPTLRLTNKLVRTPNERVACIGFPGSKTLHRSLNVPSVNENDSIHHAVTFLGREHLGAVTVTKSPTKDGNSGCLAGVFSESDYLLRVLKHDLNPAAVPVGEVMTPDPVTISPTTTLAQVGDLMTRQGRKHLPVSGFIGDPMDNDSRVLDLVSYRDLFECARAVTERYYQKHEVSSATAGSRESGKASADLFQHSI